MIKVYGWGGLKMSNLKHWNKGGLSGRGLYMVCVRGLSVIRVSQGRTLYNISELKGLHYLGGACT